MLKVVELTAGAVCALCVLMLLIINAIRFIVVYGTQAVVVFCCVGGVVLWVAGG